MNRVDEAKEQQGYRAVNDRVCANCAHLKFEMRAPKWMVEHNEALKRGEPGYPRPYDLEQHAQAKSLRCGVGNFAVKKTSTCNQYEAKGESDAPVGG